MFNLSRTDRNSFPELARVRVPVLLAIGTVEEAFATRPRDFVDAARQAMAGTPSFTGAVIAGAPHNYLGHETKLAAVLRRWLVEHAPAWLKP
jgi:hypothetical protein